MKSLQSVLLMIQINPKRWQEPTSTNSTALSNTNDANPFVGDAGPNLAAATATEQVAGSSVSNLMGYDGFIRNAFFVAFPRKFVFASAA